ncbi:MULTISPECIES: FAD:protein FMN transferase [Providencia]|uniref:FAD:protein FMN transferase n=1 Tax=Providencia rustigianii DSM 4541 TaxID=500637 RepID=D1P5W2_9GAMM|nr:MULTISPECIES: FAD:protein FMN transferase [Providencia]EFB71085.1 ApbE family protein [Providencia rustigianii DSM 4541]MTC58380.1 FAD:protein FMN transferase ApbE [Providencia rustigianii]SPY76777.1 Thiamine biosynthesis lipoprotein ApbE precursor [Providencia rustigianii]SUC26000.1 Thiamine biosynthesis lipoprotein ApbE precursor [Providencia rustigianii]
MLNRKVIAPVLLFAATLFLAACGGPEQQNLQGQTMGTYYSVKYVTDSSEPTPEVIQTEIDKRLEEVNDQMSTYRPGSELSRFNQSTEVNVPFPVSAATAKVVSKAIEINKLTDGSLDVTVGPLVNLWGFGPEGRVTKAPTDEDLAKRRAWIGIDKLAVQDNNLIKTIPELYVDLSSIAKGYGVDVVAEYLESLNINNYMVDIGGEVRTKGKNGKDAPWRIAIEKPATDGVSQTAQEIIEPGDLSIATSGDYRNYFEQDGVHFSHTIDPKTGKPISHKLVSITVLADDCMTADGLSTGLNVLGPEAGLALAEKMNVPVFMIVKTDKGFEERYTKAFEPFLQKKQ